MKRLSYLILLLSLTTGCINDELNNETSTISLKAPNGEYIANNIHDLNVEVEKFIASQYGKDLNFKIKSIDYTPLKEGYLANISYEVSNGNTHNFIKTNNLDLLTNSQVDEFKLEMNNTIQTTQKENEYILTYANSRNANARAVMFVCKSASNCTPCKVEVTPNQPTESSGPTETKVTCTETCKDCKLEATIIEQ